MNDLPAPVTSVHTKTVCDGLIVKLGREESECKGECLDCSSWILEGEGGATTLLHTARHTAPLKSPS